MNIPINTILQLSQPDGSIKHQGFLGTNINDTTIQNTFPTQPTGNSTGHYIHWGINGNFSEHLNLSAETIGGHNFWNSTSTSAPLKMFSITKDFCLLDTLLKNTTNNVNLDMINNQLIITNANYQTILNNFNLAVKNTGTAETSYIQSDNISIVNDFDTTSNIMRPTHLKINEEVTGKYSQLTTTNLFFNDVSIFTRQITTINQYFSASLYPDGTNPTTPPSIIVDQYAYSPSWYFINTSSGYINWRVEANMMVGDILGLYLSFLSVNSAPSITIYTSPTGTDDFSPDFHSSVTYNFVDATPNTRYTEFINISCSDPNHYNSTLANMIQSGSQGDYEASQEVSHFAIQSDPTAPENTVEFAINKFGIITPSGTTEINYFPQ